MALTITEDWIRERVNLKHNNLEDVRSLALPGTYQEKIVSLGDSLKHFSRLKTLDLSRNAIESIAGIESLKLLEKLNIYYNNISSLSELMRLKSCQNLQELDLRLNPVARTEPDYRLFLIHMLPNLQKLVLKFADDRAIRDNERKAALMHFTTDQAAEFSQSVASDEPKEKKTNPRVEHIRTLGRPFALDNDDVRLMDVPNDKFIGPEVKMPLVEDYPKNAIRDMDQHGIGFEQAEKDTENMLADVEWESEVSQSSSTKNSFLAKYPHLLHIAPSPFASTISENQLSKQKKTKVQFNKDSNLTFGDEIEAYTSYKAQGSFTPHPDLLTSNEPVVPVINDNVADVTVPGASSDVRLAEFYNEEFELNKPPKEVATKPQEKETEQTIKMPKWEPPTDGDEVDSTLSDLSPSHRNFLEKISELSDKYWNGAKSLLKHPRFRSSFVKLLQDYDGFDGTKGGFNGLHEENQRLRDENYKLKEKLVNANTSSEHEENDDGDEKLKNSFIKAQRDVMILKNKLQKCMDENRLLEEKLALSQVSFPSVGAGGDGQDVEQLRIENERLRQQSVVLNTRLKHMQQMQDLTNMLQESHRSLVQTNQHLLIELEDMRKQFNKQQPSSKRNTPNGS